LRDAVEEFERAQIEKALRDADGNQGRAAASLGLSRRALLDKLDAHGIERPRKKPPPA
jgi:DNA-binding NtrC family response regulator